MRKSVRCTNARIKGSDFDWFAAGAVRDSRPVITPSRRALFPFLALRRGFPSPSSLVLHVTFVFPMNFTPGRNENPRRNEAKLISPTASELIRENQRASKCPSLRFKSAARDALNLIYGEVGERRGKERGAGPEIYAMCLKLLNSKRRRRWNLVENVQRIKSRLVCCRRDGTRPFGCDSAIVVLPPAFLTEHSERVSVLL